MGVTRCGGSVSVHTALGAWRRGTEPAEGEAMNNLLRGGIAGVGAWWLGGGIFSTLVIFGLLYWFLGHFH